MAELLKTMWKVTDSFIPCPFLTEFVVGQNHIQFRVLWIVLAMALYCLNGFTALLLHCWDCLTPVAGAGRHTQQGTSQLQLQRLVSVFPWLGCTAGRISRFLLPGQLRVIFRALWSCPINTKFFKKSQLVPSPVFILKLYLPVIFLSNFKSKPAKIIFGNINLFLYTVNKKCRNVVNPLMPFKIFPEALLPVTPSPTSWAVELGHQPLVCQMATVSVQIHFRTWNSNADSTEGCVCKTLVFECLPHIHLHFLPFLTLWSAVGCLAHRELIIH